MSGGTFVKTIFLWLTFLLAGGAVAIVPVAAGDAGVWWLMAWFAVVWVPLTLRLAWLAGMDIQRNG